MVFLDELAKHTETAYGVVALIFVFAIAGLTKVAKKSHKVILIFVIVAISTGSLLIISFSSHPSAQVLNQSNNGNGGIFNINSGTGVQVNNVNKK